MIQNNWFGEWTEEEKTNLLSKWNNYVISHAVGIIISEHDNKRAAYLWVA